MPELDALDHAIIDHLQGGFPLVERPFEALARQLGSDETHLIERIGNLLARKVLTRFGPLFQVERMGGAFVLAAMAVPESDFATVTAQVNALPAVAHNYRRDHALNMWFVLATETPAGIGQAIDRIEADTGLKVYPFPKEKEYFVEMKLPVHANQGSTQPASPAAQAPEASPHIAPDDAHLKELDRQLVLATQAGLPLLPRPFHQLGETLGLPAEAVMFRLNTMLTQGKIRRIGAVPNHYAIGWTANGMTVWDVPDDVVDHLGGTIGELPFVTHCYRRPRALPAWPYNLFAMVHGASREEVSAKAATIAERLAPHCRGRDILYSTEILKKTGLRLQG